MSSAEVALPSLRRGAHGGQDARRQGAASLAVLQAWEALIRVEGNTPVEVL
jgi:hypothetical protein